MKASYHVIASAGLASGFYAVSHDLIASGICFLSGVLIDLDHHLEFFIFRKRIPWAYPELHDFCYNYRQKHVFLFFHAFEYVLLLWVLIVLLHLNALYVGFALGVSLHMACDQFTNPIKPFFYFISYRIFHRFKAEKIMNEHYLKLQLDK